MKKLLIIGGSKFIGKSFIRYFNNEKTKINLVVISRKKIIFKKKNKLIRIIKKDFKNISSLPQCDFILYCLRTETKKKDDILFEIFKKKLQKLKNKPKIIFTSSGVIYGLNNKKKKISELKNLKKNGFKDLKNYKKKWFNQKINLEKKFKELSKLNYNVVILRMFTFIGPSILNQNYTPSILKEKIIRQKKININGPLNTYRSYLDENDMVEWIIKIFKKNSKRFGTYNFGSENAIRIYDLAAKMTNKKMREKIVLLNKSNRIDYYVPSVVKLKKCFNIKEKISLNKSIFKLMKI
tara:strand:- start:1848 stop:2732 length:885 start_codon:yes stop_codon:yes gene_type:complete